MRRGNGDIVTTEIIETDGTMITAKVGNGCVYKRRIDSYAPAFSWKNCGGGTGKLEFNRFDSIFPLTVGSKAEYAYTGLNANREPFEVTRRCTVDGTARIAVPAGNFETFHIVCQDGSWTRNYYYAPELGIDVRSDRSKNAGFQQDNYVNELVSYSPIS
ncbi:MAG: hypothetical protein AAFP68_16475 [Pseudomonadota bacterium]